MKDTVIKFKCYKYRYQSRKLNQSGESAHASSQMLAAYYFQMEQERDHSSQFIIEGFTSYCKRKRRDKSSFDDPLWFSLLMSDISSMHLFGPRVAGLTNNNTILYLDLPSNMIGSFFMGWFGVVFKKDITNNVSEHLAIAITTGYLGSLTTFSGWNQKMLDPQCHRSLALLCSWLLTRKTVWSDGVS